MENRAFIRIPFEMSATIDVDGRSVAVRVRDLSIHGAFIEGVSDVSAGEGLTLRIKLGDGPDGPVIESRSKITRVCDEGVGVEFVETGIESFGHLEAVVQANSGDPERVLDEMQAYLAGKM
ncbi:MAG: PilZ domain-containing protein [Planctomycetota bacterium]